MPHALKPLCLIQFWSWENFLFPLLTLLGNKNWPPQYEGEKVLNISEQKGLNLGASLIAPGTQNPLSHPVLKLGEFPFPITGPLG